MVSSEKTHSGGRSNFSYTCSLLSQYLKEKGSFGDLSLSLISETKGTMDLLPKIEQIDQSLAAGNLDMNREGSLNSGSKESGQMTIFYAGQVVMLDDFPADKAKEMMTLARNCSADAKIVPTLSSDLPIARKNSIARFLEKRKDRITANAPYQASKATVKKEEPWLDLGSQFPFQIQRQGL